MALLLIGTPRSNNTGGSCVSDGGKQKRQTKCANQCPHIVQSTIMLLLGTTTRKQVGVASCGVWILYGLAGQYLSSGRRNFTHPLTHSFPLCSSGHAPRATPPNFSPSLRFHYNSVASRNSKDFVSQMFLWGLRVGGKLSPAKYIVFWVLG